MEERQKEKYVRQMVIKFTYTRLVDVDTRDPFTFSFWVKFLQLKKTITIVIDAYRIVDYT